MKEREIDALVMPLANARGAHQLSVHRVVATVLEDQTLESANPNGYDEVVFMRKHGDYRSFFLLGYIHKSRKKLTQGNALSHEPSAVD